MANRDLKHSTRPSSSGKSRNASKRNGGGSIITGIVIGLIVGIAIAVGLALYLNRSGTPFSNLQKLDRRAPTASDTKVELLSPGTKISEAKPDVPASKSAEASKPVSIPPIATNASSPKPSPAPAKQNNADDQRFDFYKILPGQADPVVKDNKPAQSQEPSRNNSSQKVYLQLGAFQNENDADNLKAKLALLGIEAKIQSSSIPDKGMLHRVRIGPFAATDDVERLKTQLKQNGINTVVVKADQ